MSNNLWDNVLEIGKGRPFIFPEENGGCEVSMAHELHFENGKWAMMYVDTPPSDAADIRLPRRFRGR